MSPQVDQMATRAIDTLRNPSSHVQAAETIQSLLEMYGSQFAGMPSHIYHDAIAVLTSARYAHLEEDVDATVALDALSPLNQLRYALERVFPATHVGSTKDCETAAVRVLQRLMERRASLEWYMVHPHVTTATAKMTKSLIQEAFATQNPLGQPERNVDPVIFALDYPVVCSLQSLYENFVHGFRQQTFVSIVRTGFLRLSVMPWYMLGYEGYDNLMWLQKGFRVRVGGFSLPDDATPLSTLAWQLTDYQLERRMAYNPETGAVVHHNARVLTH